MFFVFSPIFFWHLFSCHFWLPLKYLEFAINCIKLQNVSDWRLEIEEDSQKNFFNPGLDWRLDWRLKIEDSQKNFFNPIQVWIEDWRLKILRKTSSIQVWIEDWRFSEKLLQSRSRLKKSFWESSIFNLQSRPGLKKFFWESSIFNPIHFAINCN